VDAAISRVSFVGAGFGVIVRAMWRGVIQIDEDPLDRWGWPQSVSSLPATGALARIRSQSEKS